MGDTLKISPMLSQLPTKEQKFLHIPSSKSHTMRALLLGALLPGISTIDHILPSPDTSLLIHSLECLGAKITYKTPTSIAIQGSFPWKKMDTPIDVGNSGIQLRFLAALASLSPHPYQIQGDALLNQMRPVHDLLQGLEQLGATYSYLGEFGKAPFIIQGPIQTGKVLLSGEDSQPISALLLTLSFLGEGGEIAVKNPNEIPWIKMTLNWLKRLGAQVEVSRDYRSFKIVKEIQKSSFHFSIPSDYSSLAYPFSLAIITKTPVALGMFTQMEDEGDVAFLRHIQETLGSHFTISNGYIIPALDWKWQASTINLSDCSDLTSLFAVLATRSDMPTQITGIAGVKNKECDRLEAIAAELKKMGGDIKSNEDGLEIHPSILQGAKLNSWGDHRMVLALSIAAMMARGESYIENASCILKSYPGFVEEMQKLGFAWEWV